MDAIYHRRIYHRRSIPQSEYIKEGYIVNRIYQRIAICKEVSLRSMPQRDYTLKGYNADEI